MGETEKCRPKNNITPSALLCTAYANVLGFWSNQERLAINLTIFNRYPFHEDLERIVGDFTSVILLDVNLRSGNTLLEKAKNLQDTLLGALEHRHYEGVEFIRELAKYHNYGKQGRDAHCLYQYVV